MIKKSSLTSSIQGFTLIELSVVLVIIGLLVGLGAGMIGPLTTFVKVRETRDMQDASLQSIISWASSRNSIPHAFPPADPLYVSNTAFTTVAKSPLDAWGRNMIYLYDTTLYSTSPTKDTICGRNSTALTLVTTDPAATINNVAFTVLSGADNTVLKSTLNGNLNGVVTNGVITASGYTTGPSTITVTGPNSDLVRWVTLDELRSKIGCQGAPLKILNNELPIGSATNGGYQATISADGGVQFTAPDNYRWCVQTTIAGTAPAGLIFTKPDTTTIPPANLFQSNCLTYPVSSWPLAGQLVLSGTPAPSNSYFLTVYVSDNNANTASKPLVLTVNP